VNDGVCAGEDALEQRSVQDSALHEVHLKTLQVVPAACREVIDDRHVDPGVHHRRCQVGADEAGAARYHHAHAVSFDRVRRLVHLVAQEWHFRSPVHSVHGV
jgi:hypothetical protein